MRARRLALETLTRAGTTSLTKVEAVDSPGTIFSICMERLSICHRSSSWLKATMICGGDSFTGSTASGTMEVTVSGAAGTVATAGGGAPLLIHWRMKAIVVAVRQGCVVGHPKGICAPTAA